MKRLHQLREMFGYNPEQKTSSQRLADLLVEARVVEQAIEQALREKDVDRAADLQARFNSIGIEAEFALRKVEGA